MEPLRVKQQTSDLGSNLRLSVVPALDEEAKKRRVLEILRHSEGVGLAYVASVRAANELRGYLLAKGILAAHHHNKMKVKDRDRVIQDFFDNKYKVLVATRGLPLLRQKTDIRFVIHYQIPDSIEAYSREVSAGGRDGKPATATLLYRPGDSRTRAPAVSTDPVTREEADQVLDVIRSLMRQPENRLGVTLSAIVAEMGIARRRSRAIISQLDAAGLLERRRRIRLARAAAESDLDRCERRHHRDRARAEAIVKYAQTSRCRRLFLDEALGLGHHRECGICDSCVRGAARPILLDRGNPQAA